MGNGGERERSGGLNHRQILRRESEAALDELERDVRAVTLTAFTAGLNLSFGALLMLMALSMHDFGSDLTRQLALAGLSSIGFIIVLIGQTELFTAHTTMSVLPLLGGDTTIRRVAGRWTVMLSANLLGTAGFAMLVAALGPRLGIVSQEAIASLAGSLTGFPWPVVFGSAVLAGWLMGLATWLSKAARDTAGQLLAIVLVTGAIGVGPFHHVVFASTELLTALFAGAGTSWSQYLHVIIWAAMGNAVGGAVFVALLNYGQTIGQEALDPSG
ncbi:MAG: formate/nitrite transporter family protein [Actinomycetota bacterium]|nr:formate/nitrite transporter family protein [Actinomycetota bacterium]